MGDAEETWRVRARAVHSLALAIVLLTAVVAAAQIVEVPEVYVSDGQNWFDVAAGSDGGFVVAWPDHRGGSTPSSWRVYSRGFNGDGTARGNATRLDVSGHLTRPALAAQSAGGYAVALDYRPTNAPYAVYAMRLDAAGNRVGGPLQVNPDDSCCGATSIGSVALLPSGPLFVWYEYWVHSRRFGAVGVPLDGGVQVSTTQAAGFSLDAVALAGGGHAVVWHDVLTTATYSRTYDDAGNPRGDQVVLATSLFDERIASSPSGGFAVVGVQGNQVWSQRFSDLGAPASGMVLVGDVGAASNPRADIEFDLFGNAYVVWGAFSQDGGVFTPVQARVLDAVTHQPLGPAVEISTRGYNVRTSRLPNGKFVNAFNRTTSSIYANVVSVCGPGAATCGDGAVDPPCEACDDGEGNSDTAADACRTSCLPAGCGDNVIDSGEECDDGNSQGGDGCDQACLIERCGNERIEGNETCDDGNLEDGDGCDSNCTPTRCGNGLRAGVEECDDGNATNGDGCDRTCLIEQCGNRRVEGNEACDDGGQVDGDGCQANCSLTPVFDAVLALLRPLSVSLPATAEVVTRKARLVVRNVDSVGLQILRVKAIDDTCPAGTVAAPDFDPSSKGSQDVIALAPGERAVGSVEVRIPRASFKGIDARMPRRCTLRLSVGTEVPGRVDSRPENNETMLVVDVYDRGATGGGDFHLVRAKPLSLRIPTGVAGLERNVQVRARSTATGAAYAFVASDGSCPKGSVTLAAVDDKRGQATITLRLSPASVRTTNLASPFRCTALIAAAAQPNADPSNDTVPLVLDIVDLNDP